jgi:hypothetical protein
VALPNCILELPVAQPGAAGPAVFDLDPAPDSPVTIKGAGNAEAEALA